MNQCVSQADARKLANCFGRSEYGPLRSAVAGQLSGLIRLIALSLVAAAAFAQAKEDSVAKVVAPPPPGKQIQGGPMAQPGKPIAETLPERQDEEQQRERAVSQEHFESRAEDPPPVGRARARPRTCRQIDEVAIRRNACLDERACDQRRQASCHCWLKRIA